MKASILALLIVLGTVASIAQTPKEIRQEKREINRSLDVINAEKYAGSIFDFIHRSWIANQSPSYVALGSPVASVGERRVPLIEGEGASSNYSLLEANVDLQYPLFFGRKKYGSVFKRLNKVTLDYRFNFRMTLDESKPLTPSTNRVGFSWLYNIWNNRSGWTHMNIGEREYKPEYTVDPGDQNIRFWNFMFRAHHYSNGQSGESTFTQTDQNGVLQTRNNYKDGDFSTNYFYLELTKGTYVMDNMNLHLYSLGYRWDWEFGEALDFSDAQTDAYGKHRAYAKYDYHSGAKEKFKYHVRAEASYILDNLDLFQANLVNDSNKYRFASRLLFEFTPNSHRSVGYFISGYYGRDYLNIRYDDIVVAVHWGLTLSLDKYFVPDINNQ